MPQRVAIYARKSRYTGAGESIENQIALCREYAQRQFGADCEAAVYEDEGFSGRNTERPQFKRLLCDLRTGEFAALICYRLDRISRSVSDFSAILEELGERGVAFISIRESFDTSTPMGRAMIHIASVFAELERETIAERIRDNKYKLYRTGRWQGGTPPLGFRAVKEQALDEAGQRRSCYWLEPDPAGQERVCMLYQLYRKLGSASQLERYLLQNHIPAPQGGEYSRVVLTQILKNPVYATASSEVYDYLALQGADLCNCREEYDGQHGLIAYAKTAARGNKNAVRQRNKREGWIVAVAQHEGVIPGKEWVDVQQSLQENAEKYPRAQTSSCALFSGLIRCGECGAPMLLKGNRDSASGEKLYYYACSRKTRSGGELCKMKNIQGPLFDDMVIRLLKEEFSSDGRGAGEIEEAFKELEIAQQDYEGEIRLLERRIKENEAEAVSLARKLAKCSDERLEEPMYAALRELSQEKERLEAELSRLRRESGRNRNEGHSLEIIKEVLHRFCYEIDGATIAEKRELLKAVVRSIIWYGDRFDIELFTQKEIRSFLTRASSSVRSLNCGS